MYKKFDGLLCCLNESDGFQSCAKEKFESVVLCVWKCGYWVKDGFERQEEGKERAVVSGTV